MESTLTPPPVQHSALTKKGLRRDLGSTPRTSPPGSALCPDEEGIKTPPDHDAQGVLIVQHSALTKKGLRLAGGGRAPAPALLFSTLP